MSKWTDRVDAGTHRIDPTTGHVVPVTQPMILTPGPADLEVLYEGSSGEACYLHVTAVNEDGTVHGSRGYYSPPGGEDLKLPADARLRRTGQPVTVQPTKETL